MPGKCRLNAMRDKLAVYRRRPLGRRILVCGVKRECRSPAPELNLHGVMWRRLAPGIYRAEHARQPVAGIVLAGGGANCVCQLLATFLVHPCCGLCRRVLFAIRR